MYDKSRLEILSFDKSDKSKPCKHQLFVSGSRCFYDNYVIEKLSRQSKSLNVQKPCGAMNAMSKHMKCSHISEILFLCCSPSSRRASIACVCTLFDFREKSKDRHTQNFVCWENPNPLKNSAMLPREYENSLTLI